MLRSRGGKETFKRSTTMEILLVAFFLKFERGADYADYAELRVYKFENVLEKTRTKERKKFAGRVDGCF